MLDLELKFTGCSRGRFARRGGTQSYEARFPSSRSTPLGTFKDNADDSFWTKKRSRQPLCVFLYPSGGRTPPLRFSIPIRWTPARSLRFSISSVGHPPAPCVFLYPSVGRPLPAFFYIIRWTPARSLCFFISIRWTPAPCVFLYPSGGRPPPAFFYIIRWTHARSGVPSTHHNLPFRNSFPRSPGGRCKAPPPPSVFMIRPSDETCPERGSARGKSGPRNSERFPPRRFPTL